MCTRVYSYTCITTHLPSPPRPDVLLLEVSVNVTFGEVKSIGMSKIPKQTDVITTFRQSKPCLGSLTSCRLWPLCGCEAGRGRGTPGRGRGWSSTAAAPRPPGSAACGSAAARATSPGTCSGGHFGHVTLWTLWTRDAVDPLDTWHVTSLTVSTGPSPARCGVAAASAPQGCHLQQCRARLVSTPHYNAWSFLYPISTPNISNYN